VRPPEEWVWAHSLEEAVDKPVKGQDTTLHNPSLYEKLDPEERERRRAHSMATQRVKLGGEH
jgi:hypothetical protein